MLQVHNTTNPSLNGINDVAVDLSGNVYIADALNERVLKMNSSNDVHWVYDINFLPGLASDSRGNHLVYNTTNTSVSSLSSPYAVKLDSNGNLYIAGTDKRRVVVMSSSTPIPISNARSSSWSTTVLH